MQFDFIYLVKNCQIKCLGKFHAIYVRPTYLLESRDRDTERDVQSWVVLGERIGRVELDQISHSHVASGLRKTVHAVGRDDSNEFVCAGLPNGECVLAQYSGGVPD